LHTGRVEGEVLKSMLGGGAVVRSLNVKGDVFTDEIEGAVTQLQIVEGGEGEVEGMNEILAVFLGQGFFALAAQLLEEVGELLGP
jgi:hypothetical protein